MRERYVLPAAIALKPLHQGKLSNFCGVYAILNAIQLALYPQRLARAELQRLYHDAIELLAARRKLKGLVVGGIDYDPWKTLVIELLEHVNDVHRATLKPVVFLTGSAAFNRKRALDCIKSNLLAQRPITTIFGGYLNHCSVICGYSERRLFLFDSAGLRWIGAQNLGLREYSSHKHWLLADYTFAIVDDW